MTLGQILLLFFISSSLVGAAGALAVQLWPRWKFKLRWRPKQKAKATKPPSERPTMQTVDDSIRYLDKL